MYEINILPPKMRKKRKKIKIGNPTYAPFLLLGVLGTSFFLNVQLDTKISTIKEEQEAILRDIRSLEGDVQRVSSIISEIESLRMQLQMKNEASNKTLPWDLVLDEIAATTPPEVTITSIEQGNSPNTIKIQAQTYTLTHMARMKESFTKNPHFESVDIPEFKHQNSTLLNRPVEVTFTLMAQYNPYAEQTTDNQETQNNVPSNPNDLNTPSGLHTKPIYGPTRSGNEIPNTNNSIPNPTQVVPDPNSQGGVRP